MLELRKVNFEDAQDHLHARTCQREAKKGRARSLGKSLNGHEETTEICKHKNDMYLQYENVIQCDMKIHEGARIYGAQ